MRFGLSAGPHSPLHCPLSGWPNCADAAAGTMASSAARTRNLNVRVRMALIPLARAASGPLPRLLPRAEDRLPEIVGQTIQVLVVLLADVLGQFRPDAR